MKHLFINIFICIGLTACAQTDSEMKDTDTTPVTGFELEKYLGTWYEIARFPHSFEKGLTGVTATYSMKENGKVEVLNAGYKDSLDGPFKTAKGKAKFADDPSTGHLKVSFFLFFYADYFIMELDKENYNWVLIGSSSPKYLWILCRDPHMDDDLYQYLRNKAVERGYDLALLQKVPQSGDL